MSVFLETNHLFLRSPKGGVEDVRAMKAAGFGAIFCNIKDFMPDEWEVVRQNAAREGVVCGPWSRMCSGDAGSEYDRLYLDNLIACAYDWGGTPYIVNAEDEINHRDEISREIVAECQGDDWALSMLAWPFNDNDWSMYRDVPVLPQLFGPEYGDLWLDYRQGWQNRGVRCVVHTFGSYNGTPADYPLDSPYGLYTADDAAGTIDLWKPTGNPCQPCVTIPPTNGGTVPDDAIPPISPNDIIGSEHGITAFVDWLQRQPGMPVRDAGYNPKKPGTWPWPERLERTLKILAAEHDAGG